MDGILIIDKPAGITSHDVVARCRRILRTRRVGHTGTLDPFATGVVVILVNRATRLAQFLDKDLKEYEAVARFGFETTTGDKTGNAKSEVSSPKPAVRSVKSLTAGEIEEVLKDFRGEIEQTPPMYSAKKVEGRKLYELARRGVEIERRSQKVTVYNLETIEPQNLEEAENSESQRAASEIESRNTEPETRDLRLRVLCSAGTYIRTLAEDIGRKLGVGAHLVELRRTRAGNFDLSRAATLERLEEIAAAGKIDEILISPARALSHLPEIKLSESDARKTRSGMKLKIEAVAADDCQLIRLTDETGTLAAVGIYNRAEKTIRPKVVLV